MEYKHLHSKLVTVSSGELRRDFLEGQARTCPTSSSEDLREIFVIFCKFIHEVPQLPIQIVAFICGEDKKEKINRYKRALVFETVS
jgi:hypothetical protein